MNDSGGRFWRRLLLGMSGQAFSRVTFALNSIVLVPLLIHAWGVDGYGQWIAITALASYLGLSNFGLVTTSANEMVIASGAGDFMRAKRAFQASINLTIYIVFPIIVILVSLLCLVPLNSGLHLTLIGSERTHLILAYAGAGLLFQTLRGLMAAVLYATGSCGFAYYIQGGVKLGELAAIALLVSEFSGNQASAAALTAALALVELVIVSICAHRTASWARLDLRMMDWSWLSSQFKPTVGFLVANFATQGLMAQGARVALGALLGGTAVATYAVYGTAMRVVDQLLLMLVLPLEVEIAHCSGRADLPRINRLVVAGTHISWVLFLGVSASLLLIGPLVFYIWTTGRIQFSYGLMALYICMSAANLQGRVSIHALTSTNRLYGTSFLMLAFALTAVGIGVLLIPALGVRGMVLGGILGESLNSVVAIIALARLLEMPPMALLGGLLNFKGSVGEFRVRSRALLGRLRVGV